MLKNLKNLSWLFPLLFACLIFSVVLVWLKADTNLPHWDMGRHLYHTFLYKDLWQEFFSGEKNIVGLLTMYMYYPPFVHNLGLLFNFLFGFGQDQAVYSNFIWILILSLSTFFSAKKLFGLKSAIISTIFIFGSPLLIGQIREFQLDFPQAALFALSFWLLLESDYLKNRRISIILGVVCGIGMVVKWNFVFFAFPTIAIYLAKGWFDYTSRRSQNDMRLQPASCNQTNLEKNKVKRVLVSLILIFIAAMFVCGPWYLRNLEALRADFAQNGVKQAVVEGDPYGINFAAMTWYLKGLFRNYLFLPLGVIFILGLITSFFKRKFLAEALFLFLILLSFYFITSLLPNKDIRYFMPAIFLVALFAGSIVRTFENKYFFYTIFSVVSILFIINNLTVAFGDRLPAEYQKEKVIKELQDYGIIFSNNGYTSNSAKKAVCPMDQVISSIPEKMSAREIGSSKIDFSDWAVAYNLRLNNRKWAGQQQDYFNADYLISRDTSMSNPYLTEKGFKDRVILKEQFSCLDGSIVSVLKVKK